jgi:PmbA protein
MKTEKKLKNLAKNILNQTGFFDQTEVILGTTEQTTIRFAQNHIYQPLTVKNIWLKIRFIKNKKILVLNLASFSEKQIKKTIAKAKNLIKYQQKDKNFASLPKAKPIKINKETSFSQQTKNLKAAELIKQAGKAITLSKKNHLTASGKLEKSIDRLLIANSLGTFQYQPSTLLSFSTVIHDEQTNSSGYGQAVAKQIKNLNIEKEVKKTIKTAKQSKHPKKIKTADYEVILMPSAFQEILPFFSWLGPNARIYHEEVSFLKGKIGRQIFSPKLNIIDNPKNSISPSFFDFEGYPKKKITLVKNGVPKQVVYDSYYAEKYNKKNTGHGLPAPNTQGPIPLHLVIKPGSTSLEKMIKTTKKGLLINRLWYIRVVHYKNLVLTGMTRDGTFLIENGKIKHPVKNLRFTDSIPNMLKNITQLENMSYWQDLMWGIAKIPAVKIKSFKFTS